MMFTRRVVLLIAAVFLQLGTPTTAIDKSDKVRQTGEPVSAQEQDILETVAKHPLGAQVKAKDGSWKPAKYGDPKLAVAVEHLASIPKPWTVLSITRNYHAMKGKNDQLCAHLLRVLAASRDPRAATVLGPALSDGSLAIRVAATYGIMDYFMDHPVNGGTEQHMEAAQQWWQQQQTKAQAESDSQLRKQLTQVAAASGAQLRTPASAGRRADKFRQTQARLISAFVSAQQISRLSAEEQRKRIPEVYERLRPALVNMMVTVIPNAQAEILWRERHRYSPQQLADELLELEAYGYFHSLGQRTCDALLKNNSVSLSELVAADLESSDISQAKRGLNMIRDLGDGPSSNVFRLSRFYKEVAEILTHTPSLETEAAYALRGLNEPRAIPILVNCDR